MDVLLTNGSSSLFFQNPPRLAGVPVLLSVLLCLAASPALADQRAMKVEIDARDLPRKLLSSTVHLPVDSTDGKVIVWYPKWVPGSHAPGGPIANVAGLKFEDNDGNQLSWRRTPGEVYRFEVDAPQGTEQIVAHLRYITNQPTANAVGLDSYGSTRLGMVSPNTVLLYVEGMNIDSQIVNASIQLPESWSAATALRAVDGEDPTKVIYHPASLRDVVDSPIMCGRHCNAYELAEGDSDAPPHTLHVFTDDAQAELPDAIIERLRAMVTQTSRLIGSHPFDRFDILLAVTDRLSPNGLEHARSTFNILPPSAMTNVGAWKGWNRLLIPHEYLHAWCGKYRRPAGMLTGDFHTPKGTELLWVYEGLTQYLGELVEARSGIMSEAEFLHRFEIEVRRAIHQQGRKWRSLADTAAASHVLRASSPAWSSLRRSQDYYMEGMLLWIEIDAILRQVSEGKVTIDDFCRRFFDATTRLPRPYDRAEVVQTLGSLAEYPWDELIQRRVYSTENDLSVGYVEQLGFKLEIAGKPTPIPGNTFRYVGGVDLLDSIGATISSSGRVSEIVLDSPADDARLAPGMTIVAVNDRTWSRKAMLAAIASTNDTPIVLTISDGDLLVKYEIDYAGGTKYLVLKKPEDGETVLDEILKPRG